MAITITYKSSIYNTAAGNMTCSPTWTPTANSMMVAWVVNSYTAGTTINPSAVAGHGVSYTNVGLAQSTLPAASATHKISLWVGLAGGSPTSAACVVTVSGTTTGGCCIEFEVTGQGPGTALQNILDNTSGIGTTGTSHTVTLNAARQEANRAMVFCVQLNNANQSAAGSWTLTAGATGNYNTPATGAIAVFRNDAFDTAGAVTGASTDWRTNGIEIATAHSISPDPG